MTPEKWVDTCRQYSVKNDEGVLQPDIEHARALKERVKNAPEAYVNTLYKLGTNNDIAIQYLISGIEGLKEVEFDAMQIQPLFKIAMNKAEYYFDIMSLVWLCNYLTQNGAVDYEIFKFLKQQAIYNKHPEQDKDESYQHGINTVRGSAIREIVNLYGHKEWETELFSVAEQVVHDHSIAVKNCLLQHLAFFMNLDKERTLQIFLKLLSNNPQVIEAAAWSAQYLSSYNFDKLKPYIEMAIDSSEESKKIAVSILIHLWARDFKGSYPLLKKALKKPGAKETAVHVCRYNLVKSNKNIDAKYSTLFCKYLNKTNLHPLQHEYSTTFLHLRPQDFNILFPILKKFSKSKFGQVASDYYFSFLYDVAKQYPLECIELIGNLKSPKKLESFGRIEKDNPIKVVIGAYNRLYCDNPSHPANKKALDLLDKLLAKQEYRARINTIFNNVER